MRQALTINGRVKIWPETFISLRLGVDWLELVYSDGVALIEGVHLQHLARLLLHGRIEQLKEGWSLEDFGCVVDRVRFGQARQSLRGALPFPDSCPVPDGWLCVEGIRFADYHPEASLQLIALQRGGFLLGFAQDSYQGCPGEAEGILEQFGEDVRHVTAWDAGRFLPWPTVSRLQATDLETLPHRPESWDSMEAVRDLRGEAAQRQFMQRIKEAPRLAIKR